MGSATRHPTTRSANRFTGRRGAPNDQPVLFELDLPKPTDTYETSVYQLERVPPTAEGLRAALNRRYLAKHDFTTADRLIAGAPALLVHGTVPREQADWCDVLTSLTGDTVAVSYSSGGAALLVVVDGRVYGLAYGALGRYMINVELANPGFGIAFAVRSLAADEIKQVQRRVFGPTGRLDRSMVLGGQHIRMYGIDKCGEIVGQISGRVSNPALTVCRVTGKATPVECGQALRIHLGVDPESLHSDLREIDRVCQQEPPFPDLEFISQIRPVPATDPRLPDLEQQLDQLLSSPNPAEIGLAVPSHLLGEIEQVQSYRLRVPKSNQRPAQPAELTLADVLTQTQGVKTDGERWTALRNGNITIYADRAGKERITSTRASRWITAQLAHGSSQLVLHEESWYELGDRHREFLRQEIEQILTQPASISLPPWRSGEDEKAYNKRASKSGTGFVLLDRKLLRTAQHRRQGIEACDLLGPDDELIHVKRATSSAPLSHLFAQGDVSVNALKYAPDAREALVRMVRRQSRSRGIGLDFRPRKVVYAIALGSGKTLTADSLFTFAQVALYRSARFLRNEGVAVEVVSIPVI